MSVRGGQVHKAALGDDEQRLALGQLVARDVVPRLVAPDGVFLQARHVYLHVEVACVREDGPVLHEAEVLLRDDVAAAGDGAEDVAQLRGLTHGHDFVAVHDRLQRVDRVRLRHDYLRAQARRAQGHALAAPAVAGHDDIFARDYQVRRAHDAVPDALARAVAVVEQVLAVRVVHHHHGEGQDAVARELLQADYAGGRLLAAAYDTGQEIGKLRAHELHELAAVVDDDVGADGQDCFQLLFVLLRRRAVGGVDLQPSGGQGSGHVVLRREGVRARDVHLRATRCQHAAKIGRLGLQMDGQRHLHARKGLLALKIRLDAAQHWHIPAHPGYLHFSGWGKGDVSDIVH